MPSRVQQKTGIEINLDDLTKVEKIKKGFNKKRESKSQLNLLMSKEML